MLYDVAVCFDESSNQAKAKKFLNFTLFVPKCSISLIFMSFKSGRVTMS